jgi:hypothetical protein
VEVELYYVCMCTCVDCDYLSLITITMALHIYTHYTLIIHIYYTSIKYTCTFLHHTLSLYYTALAMGLNFLPLVQKSFKATLQHNIYRGLLNSLFPLAHYTSYPHTIAHHDTNGTRISGI